jgi:26S proteasome regulatory subunit N4
MTEIEKGLHEFHAAHIESTQDDSHDEIKPSVPASASASDSRDRSPNQPLALPETVFARVNSVVANSPADTAGLKAGDGIVRFGDVDFMNHANLSRVSTLVQSSQGVSD